MTKIYQPSQPPKFHTVSEVADQVGVCTRTVRRWIEHGLLKVHRIGGVVRISDEDLCAFLDGYRV